MTPTEAQGDRKIMGTPEAAREALILQARNWRKLRQPIIGTAKEIRRIEVAEREARFCLANAALLWL